jgi:hypothetical protein
MFAALVGNSIAFLGTIRTEGSRPMTMKDIDLDVEAILARLDQSSLPQLALSLAHEIARSNELFVALFARVAAIEALQVVNDRIVDEGTILSPDQLPRSVRFDATYSLPRSNGLYALEYIPGGKPFRWTGPDPAFSFEFFVNRTEGAQAILHFERLYRGSPEEIRCLVDGKTIPTRVVEGPEGLEIRANLPSRDDAGGTALTFVCPNIASPAEHEGNKDTRRLGLAFQSLNVDSLALGAMAPDENVAAARLSVIDEEPHE